LLPSGENPPRRGPTQRDAENPNPGAVARSTPARRGVSVLPLLASPPAITGAQGTPPPPRPAPSPFQRFVVTPRSAPPAAPQDIAALPLLLARDRSPAPRARGWSSLLPQKRQLFFSFLFGSRRGFCELARPRRRWLVVLAFSSLVVVSKGAVVRPAPALVLVPI